MPRLLQDSDIQNRLRHLKGWRHKGAFVTKTFEFKSFMDGIKFIDSVARVAEEQEHHPDIHIRFTTITLSVQTHSEGGVTEWDLELIESIEEMLHRSETRQHRR